MILEPPSHRVARPPEHDEPPRIIVGNVDCEAQCGEPERRSRSERWESTVVAHRLIWLCRSAHDLCVFPALLRPEMLAYVGEVLGIPLSEENQVAPELAGGAPTLLTERVMAELDVILRVRGLLAAAGQPTLASYFVDPGLAHFCQRHGLGFPYPDSGKLEPLNRKSFFRGLAESLGVPTAPGRVCRTHADLSAAISELLPRTGTIIIKQDLAGGGEGNVAVTSRADRSVFIGTSATHRIGPTSSTDAVAHKIFDTYTGARNTCLIVESYVDAQEVVYSELLTGEPKGTCLVDWGLMLMEPKWIGFEIPSPTLSPAHREALVHHSLRLGDEVGRLGYHGRMNCDALVTRSGELLFTEINVRLGGCTHVDILARHLLGPRYADTHVIRTRNAIAYRGGLRDLRRSIGELHFAPGTSRGVIVLTEHLSELGTFESMCIGSSSADAKAIEDVLLARVRAAA